MGNDLKDGYWQVELDEESQGLTTFSTPTRRVCYTTLPQGFVNSSHIFCRLIQTQFYDLDYVICYLDDLSLGAKTFDILLERLEIILTRLRKIGAKLSGEKSIIGVPEINILGNICSNEGVRAEEKKNSVIKNWPKPNTVTEMRSFLGTVKYLRRWIQNCAGIIKPLTAWTGGEKQKIIVWDNEMNDAFNQIKTKIISEALAHPRFGNEKEYFIIRTDASKFAEGAQLSQMQMNEEGTLIERTIAFASRMFQPNEVKWSITEKECHALVWAVTKEFHRY
eukprot:Pgem_evm1s2262